MAVRKEVIQLRVDRLVGLFPMYLSEFEKNSPFGRPAQLSLHMKVIRRRRELASVRAALKDREFLVSLRGVLHEWGLGTRGSVIVEDDTFIETLQDAAVEIAALNDVIIDGQEKEVASAIEKVVALAPRLSITTNAGRLVPVTKTLHHLLPDLVPPMDREYTCRSFGWHPPEVTYQWESLLNRALVRFAEVARAVGPDQYVGEGWCTSRTKVLDNAVVGFCWVENLPRPS